MRNIDPRHPSRLDIPPHSHGLWSLWDIMQRFRAASFGVVMASLGRATEAINVSNFYGIAKDDASDRAMIQDALKEVGPELLELPLSRVLRDQFERLVKSINRADGAELAILVREFANNLMVELSSSWFLMVFADNREHYEQRRPAFGEPVALAFIEASGDIAAASRCLALDEWTACVFHLMRVLEHGLRTMAEIVGLPSDAMQHENWKNIIDQIEKKIREMEALPKTPEKVIRIQILSEAALQFRYFKDAWRNHVSHAHASYDNHTVPLVFVHVRAFMQHMAAQLAIHAVSSSAGQPS